ncbi:MAG: acetyl-CoA carboxylase carboxyltransferase subunit beta [Deltaproteobacteria bacterium]|nr:acetyl-CoA carboxylase carboxyltransferase subunit beta [Deltaproteobacteria bacterium]
MAWWKKEKPPETVNSGAVISRTADGLWRKCDGCGEILYAQEVAKNAEVCPRCQLHFPISVTNRIAFHFDEGSFRETDAGVRGADPLEFRDSKKYRDRLKAAEKSVGRKDAIVTGSAWMEGIPVRAGLFDFAFMGGSMGSAVGEKIARLFDGALAAGLPVVLFSCSGGARMQEGTLSLMQMAKTVQAIARFRAGAAREGVARPFVSVLLNPTTGGVAASFSMLGDIIVAEPKALVGFAGPRVIQETLREKLPPGFQRAEYLLEHGMIDAVVERRELKTWIARSLRLLGCTVDPKSVAHRSGATASAKTE